VGDQSDFVNALGRVLKDAGPRLGAALSDIHFRWLNVGWCNLAVAILPEEVWKALS